MAVKCVGPQQHRPDLKSASAILVRVLRGLKDDLGFKVLHNLTLALAYE